jgi:hypothetical protein
LADFAPQRRTEDQKNHNYLSAAHPGGGLIALNANTVIFGDSLCNTIWQLEQGRKPPTKE